MQRFCTNCGNELKPEHNVCVQCGTPAKQQADAPIEDEIEKKDVNEELQENGTSGVAEAEVEEVEEVEEDTEGTETGSLATSYEEETTQVEKVQGELESPPPSPLASSDEKETTPKEEAKSRTEDKKQPKKSNRLWIAIGVAVVIIIGFAFWANSFQSPENVLKRYEKAVEKEDAAALTNIVIHEDESPITEHEASAYLKMLSEGYEEPTIWTMESGKFLFFFPAYKVTMPDQYAVHYIDAEGLTLLFNGEEVEKTKRSDGEIVHGPLLPGYYSIEATFSGEYGESSTEDELLLNDSSDGYTYLDLDLNVADVVVYLENYHEVDLKNTYVKINDEKITFDNEGETEPFGPFILDGNQEVQIVTEMPWGEVASEPISLDDTYVYARASYLTDEHFKQISDAIVTFSEQFVESLAKESTKPLENVSNNVKQTVADEISEYYAYTGKVDKIEIDRTNMFLNDDSELNADLFVLGLIRTLEDYHDLDVSPALSESEYLFEFGFTYDEENKSWQITELLLGSYWIFESTDTLSASDKLHGPSKEAVESATSEAFANRMEDFMNDYISASVNAINYRDFSLVEDYITNDGPRRQEAIDYIDYLDEKDVYEDFYGASVDKIEEVEENTWKVTTIEDFDIIWPDETKYKRFRTVVVVKEIDGELYVDELVSTDEID